MAYQVLVNALKAPAHLQYQLAFLSTVGLSSVAVNYPTHSTL